MAVTKLRFDTAETDFAEILDALPLGVIVSDQKGRLIHHNTLALDLLRLDRNALAERLDRDGIEPAARVLAGQEDFEHCVRVADSNGSLRLLTVKARRLSAASGEWRVLTLVRDCTVDASEHREREIQRIIDSIPASVAYFDRNEVNVTCNLGYAAFFGLTPAQVKGRSIRDLFEASFYAKNEPNVRAAMAGRPMKFESVRIGCDGQEKHLLVSYTPEVVDGRVDGMQVVITDLTDLKAMENQRREFEVQLTAASKMSLLGEMAGGIAHEINNPLSIIGGTAAILRASLVKGSPDPKALDASLVKIESTVHRIAKIIRGLKIFARDAAQDPKMIVPVETVVGDTLELCLEKMKMRGISVRSGGVRHVSARCNPTQVSQILMNLLSNAIDAVETLSDKWIELAVEADDRRVRLFVSDSGRGISPHVADKMLNPFFTTKPVGKGTGLGLSISRALAEENEGRLDYLADRDNTCFVLDLPLAVT